MAVMPGVLPVDVAAGRSVSIALLSARD
jgi:hypothetical protein